MTNWQNWNRSNQKFSRLSQPGWPILLLSGLTLMTTLALANATPVFDTESPIGFFTNVASRLLSSELNLELTWIQIYPTNQYTPAVHRLLQVTANIYDATTTNFYPSVLRPLFSRDADGLGTNLYISGYTNVPSVSDASDAQLALPINASDLAATNVPVINVPVNVYGVPWIIGAKKGFPNFNKFGMQNVVQVTRKLQIKRNKIPVTSIADFDYTNQLFIFSISNSIGVECWNSYNSNYLSSNTVQIVARDSLSMMLTNGGAPSLVFYTYPLPYSINTNITLNPGVPWPGSAPWIPNPASGAPATNSFIVPIASSVTFLTNSAFYFGTTPPGLSYRGFYPVGYNLGWETNKYDFTFPQFGLFTTNRLQVFMLDGDHVIDYVQFAGPESSRNLNAEIQNTNITIGYDNMWSTNLNAHGMPWGIISQIEVSIGDVPLNPVYWSSPEAKDQIDGFAEFMGLTAPYPISNMGLVLSYATNYIVQVPYTPTVTAYEYTSWQANDPLVHYLASDLNFYGTEKGGPTTGGTNLSNGTTASLPRPSFTRLNDRYQPWGRMLVNPNSDTNGMNLAFKDPLVRGSDYWDFPTNESSFGDWLGQIHRGTPWQTVYLKATNILNLAQNSPPANGLATWMNWTGDWDVTDAVAMAPVQDRHLVSLLASMLNTIDLRSLFSINNANPNAWLVRFDGLTALTNNLPDTFQLRLGLIPPQFGSLVISSNLPQLLVIANAIQSARASRPGRFFRDLGDILAIPQLTEQSPFLNWNDSVQQQNGISDEAYEIIPSQLMSLLRADSIGSIVPVNGQTLVQFTGYDGHSYAIEVSSNLVDWMTINTNSPANGIFSLTIPAVMNANPQFYRSVLLQ